MLSDLGTTTPIIDPIKAVLGGYRYKEVAIEGPRTTLYTVRPYISTKYFIP
jgi:hypothetical protein